MAVAFGAITSKNIHSAHRNQGIGSGIREQNRVNVQLANAIGGANMRRVGYGNRFNQNPNLTNRFATTSDSSSSSSSFNWTAAASTGLMTGVSAFAATYSSCGGGWAGAIGGVVALASGWFAGSNS